MAVLAELEADGVTVPLRMAASSGALRLTDAMTLNAIDVGSLLYGLEPPGPSDRDLGLRPALVSLSSRLTSVRTRFRTEFVAQSPIPTGRDVQLGVIPLGATDGFLGLSAGHVLVGGRRAPVLAISLEHSRLDLTGIDARVGDEVVIVGRQGDEEITMRDVGEREQPLQPGRRPGARRARRPTGVSRGRRVGRPADGQAVDGSHGMRASAILPRVSEPAVASQTTKRASSGSGPSRRPDPTRFTSVSSLPKRR